MSLLSASGKESGMTMNYYGSTKDTNDSSRDRDITVVEKDLQDGDFRYIESTAAERRRKCANALLPILIFTVLMGAIAFSLFKSFDLLYPGHGGGNSSSSRSYYGNDNDNHLRSQNNSNSYSDLPSITNNNKDEKSGSSTGTNLNSDKNSLNENKSAPEQSLNNSKANCALYSKCEMLGLTGTCCPTSSGVTLECCN